jgi:hypothetical protein
MYNFTAELPNSVPTTATYHVSPQHCCIHTYEYITVQLDTLRQTNFGFDFITSSIRVRQVVEEKSD